MIDAADCTAHKKTRHVTAVALAALLAGCAGMPAGDRNAAAVNAIDTVVVIFAENRAFDTLYGLFPGANGIPGVNPSAVGDFVAQKDFNGAVLPVLPPAWGGLTANGQPVTVTQAQSAGMPNRPFRIDDPAGLNGSGVVVSQDITTRDLVHRYYNNIMQIGDGSNDRFAAYSDAGGLSMGYYDGSKMKLWQVAQRYTLADNFFMGAFGGSYMNHVYLVCACVPVVPNVDATPSKALLSEVDTDAQGRVRLVPAANMPASVLDGAPRYKHDDALTPKEPDGSAFTVNTMQPPYQPSGNEPVANGDTRYADPSRPTTLTPQTLATIGDRLDAKGVSWAWYSGAWAAASAEPATAAARKIIYRGKVRFQPHHQPFNYFANFDPQRHADRRGAHLLDFDARFYADADAGQLPHVAFYKPQGNLNQHAGYANVADGDAHIAEVIERLQKSPQWSKMMIVVTYDENGGFWDHVRVPKGDRWGPGTRVPALIVSPLAKRGFVDHTPYDTGSILRFITRRWGLEPLPGVQMRDAALKANGAAPMGDLSAALRAPD
ncbi:MAG TPA: acid phosphatase [Burkholderiaceae bacterium]|nr:acid phosphatase [Burkholderiaceae bacterium]